MGLAIVALPLVILCLVGCVRQPADPLRVATNVWVGYEPLYLARSLGFYDPLPVRLVEMASATDVQRAFRNRLVDCAALTLDEACTVAQDDPSVRIILVVDVSHGADAVLARPEVRSASDLRGRRVGVEHTAVGAYLLARTLESARLTAGDIEVLPVTESGHEQAYTSGRVDAIVTFDPTRTRLLARGAHVIFDSTRIPNEIFDVLVVRAEVVRERPGDLQRLREVWFRALDYMATSPADAARRVAGRESLTPEQFQAALGGLRFPNRGENQRLLSGTLLEPARRLCRVMGQEKLLRHDFDPAPMLGEP